MDLQLSPALRLYVPAKISETVSTQLIILYINRLNIFDIFETNENWRTFLMVRF